MPRTFRDLRRLDAALRESEESMVQGDKRASLHYNARYDGTFPFNFTFHTRHKFDYKISSGVNVSLVIDFESKSV